MTTVSDSAEERFGERALAHCVYQSGDINRTSLERAHVGNRACSSILSSGDRISPIIGEGENPDHPDCAEKGHFSKVQNDTHLHRPKQLPRRG
jgi:hypothetical protein